MYLIDGSFINQGRLELENIVRFMFEEKELNLYQCSNWQRHSGILRGVYDLGVL